jgi:hypothetical protein
MTTNTETVNALASAIVSVLIDRLVSDQAFINGVAERVGRVDSEEVDKKITMALAEFIDSSELDAKICGEIDNAGVDEDKVDDRIEKFLQSYEVDSDNVNGLDDEIDNRIEKAIEDIKVDADTIDGLDDTIRRVVSESLSIRTSFEVNAP